MEYKKPRLINFIKIINKRLCFILCIIFGLGNVHQVLAQENTNFTWSAWEKVPKYSQSYHNIKTEKGYGVVIKNNGLLKIIYYDLNLNNKRTLKFKYSKSNEDLIGIHTYHQDLYFFFQVRINNKQNGLRIRKVNTLDLKMKVELIDLLIFEENRFDRGIDYHISLRTHYFNIWHTNPPKYDNGPLNIKYYTYDYNLKNLDKVDFVLPIENKLGRVLKIEKKSKTEFYIHTKEYDVRAIEKRAFNTNYKMAFYRINPETDSVKKCIFQNDKTFPDRGKFTISNGILSACGVFTDKQDGPIEGLWLLKYNFNLSKTEIDSIYYFEKDIKSLPNNGYKYSLLRRSPFESMRLDYFFRQSDNVNTIILEQFFLIPASFGSTYTYNRFYGDILVLYLDSNLVLQNSYRILKAQHTYNNQGEFSSYLLQLNGDKINFLYNTHTANSNNTKFKHLVWHKHSHLAQTTVDVKNQKTIYLSNYKATEGILQIRDATKISPNTYLIYARKGKKGKLGIMKIKSQE